MVIYQKRIYREDLRANPNLLYVFGDNESRSGLGGQAKEMRGEPNAFGFRTKRGPGREERDYWSDKDFKYNILLIRNDIQDLLVTSFKHEGIVFPYDGIGTGLAYLREKAPKTFEYLNLSLLELGITNGR